MENYMKSVIAQGATIAKAVEEALKKAEMPKEFFIRILEEGQSSFLGFGGKKAKIALFFRHFEVGDKQDRLAHHNLFDNPKIRQQIDQYLQDTNALSVESTSRSQQQKSSHPKQYNQPKQQKPMHKVELKGQAAPQSIKPEINEVKAVEHKVQEFKTRPLPERSSVVDGAESAQDQKPKRRRRRRYYGKRNDGSSSGSSPVSNDSH